MDGTLWDSSLQVARSWSSVTKAYPGVEKEITQDDIRSVMGLTMDKIAEALFPGMKEAARSELLKKCCVEENLYLKAHGGCIYEGVEDTLRALCGKYRLFIVSNCQKGYIEAFLDYYGLWEYIEDIECYGNNLKPKADNIRLTADRNSLFEAVYVGDIQGDFDSSRAAGVGFIHAAYGFGAINEPVPAISDIRELPAAADKFFTE